MKKTMIFAHRGASGTHPENTMEAFIAAEAMDADGIELDVQLSVDGEIVVIHDRKVNRTTNKKGYVKHYTLRELKKMDASYMWKHLNQKHHIPTLAQVFDWLCTNKLICNVEFKSIKSDSLELEEKVVNLVQDYQLEHRIIFSSFNHYSLVHCHQIAPEIETAPLYAENLFMPWTYAESIGAKGIHPKWGVISEQAIRATEENGIAVRPYTVNREKDLLRLFSYQCTAVITDFPALAVKLRDKRY